VRNQSASGQKGAAKVQNSDKLSHLEAIREDVRDEVKRRIQQRDQYSMQLTVALGAIAIGAFSAKGTPRLFILAPLVSIYYTALILYSYRIHDMLAIYLRKVIEPEFSSLTEVPTEKEWESWYHSQDQKPGIRRWFFVAGMLIVTGVSVGFILHLEWSTQGWFHVVMWGAFSLYLCFLIPTLLLLKKKQDNKAEESNS
jgi:hypothetical protein